MIIDLGYLISHYIPKITIDASLNTSSSNPVQNKAITNAINSKLPVSGGKLTGKLEAQNTSDNSSQVRNILFGTSVPSVSDIPVGALYCVYN